MPKKYQFWNTNASNEGFIPSGVLGFHNLHAGINPVLKTNDEIQTGNALLGRLNYSLMDRYLLTASVRRDGFSAFGIEKSLWYISGFCIGMAHVRRIFY